MLTNYIAIVINFLIEMKETKFKFTLVIYNTNVMNLFGFYNNFFLLISKSFNNSYMFLLINKILLNFTKSNKTLNQNTLHNSKEFCWKAKKIGDIYWAGSEDWD